MTRKEKGTVATFLTKFVKEASEKIIEPIDRLNYTQAEKEMAEELKKAEEEEGRRIGNTFRENLLSGLPDRLRDFSKIFSIPADQILKRELRQSVDVISAGREGFLLSEYGLSPKDIARVSNSLGNMMYIRIRESGLNPKDPFIYHEEARDTAKTNIVSKKDIICEVANVAEVPTPTILQLSDWMLKVLPHRPNMLSRFKYEKNGNRVQFVFNPDQDRGIKFRWSAPYL